MDLVGYLSDDVSSSSIGWWVSVTVVFFVVFKFRMHFFSALQKMVEIPLAEVTCCAIY